MASAKTFTVFTKFAVKTAGTERVTAMAKSAQKLGQNFDKLKQGAAKVGKGVAGFGKVLGGVAVAAGAAGAAIFAMAKASEESADDIQNTSNALGISTTALQEYRYAGIAAGLTTEDMDTAIRKLTVNLGKDGGDVENALYQIGLTAEDLRAAGPDKVLETVATGFEKLKDPTTKAAVATAIFGKSSVRMVNVLSKGADGVKDLREESEKVGYVMKGENLKTLGDFNDQLDVLGATATGFRDRLSAKATPALAKFVGFLQKGLQPGGQFDKLYTVK